MESKLYLTFKTEFFQEPLGGAHADPAWTSQQIKLVIKEAMEVSDLHIFAYRRGKKKKSNYDQFTYFCYIFMPWT